MSKKRTYIDASLLIAAWRGQGDIAEKAIAILEDPERALVVGCGSFSTTSQTLVFQPSVRSG